MTTAPTATPTESPINYYDDAYESLPTTVTMTYLGIVVVAFIIVAIYAAHKLRSDDLAINCSMGNWCGLILDLRKIYIHAVIHTADTVSDIAVLCQFYRLAYREQNDENFNVVGLDMTALFIGTLFFLLLYRVFTAYHFFYIAGGSILLFMIQFLDFGIYLTIYLAWKLNRTEPIFWQDYLTHVEALFESIPQILIQSQFVLKSEANTAIVIASIVISFVSVVTRFVKSDYPFVNKDCHQLLLVDPDNPQKLRSPYISWGYLALYFLRACDIVTRLVCAVFLWSVLGAIPLGFVFVVTFIISQRFLWKTKSQRFLFWYIAVPIECYVGEKRRHLYFRFFTNWLFLTIITIYSQTEAYCVESGFDGLCPEFRRQQIDTEKIAWKLNYFYFFGGWACSVLSPICWFTIVPKIYKVRKATPEERRQEIMAIPRLFYRKNGCYKPTVTPLHFAVHRKFTVQMEEMLQSKEVDINAVRISGATALHSAVSRSLIEPTRILLKYGADATAIKKELWYFRCCMPWKWCGRNWYEGKTALEIAQYKVDKEREETGQDLDENHAYMQVLELLRNPPTLADPDVGGRVDNTDGRVLTHLKSQSSGGDDDQVIGNEEDEIAIGMDNVDIDPIGAIADQVNK